MRVVRAEPRADRAPVEWPVPTDAVRDLRRRFPEANLVPTAVVRVPALDRIADAGGRARVWLALESLQVTGSFKVRGALVALAEARERLGSGAHVVAASAGNHGAGVAYAARALGLRATVVMPEGAPEAKRARVLGYGAELVETATSHYDDAEPHAVRLARDAGAAFVSPYDDPFVAAGNGGSLAFDVVRALGRVPDVVVCPLGGGGLASGLGWALEKAALEAGKPDPRRRRVWGVQSEASPAMALSLERGAAVTRLTVSAKTLAEGLEGGISETGFARAAAAIAGVIVTEEDAIARAMAFALSELGLVLEGSAATSLVPLLAGACPGLRDEPGEGVLGQDVVAILTGRNVDRERLLRLPRIGD